MWRLEEPEGLSWSKLKGRELWESRRARVRVVWLGLEEADCPCSRSFRKEDAANKSQTWPSDMSKTKKVLSKPGHFLAYMSDHTEQE